MRHALARLRERHNMEMTLEELKELANRLADRSLRRNPNLFRYVGDAVNWRPYWQANLRRYFGQTLWVTIAYDAVDPFIITVLDVPINATPQEARQHLAAYFKVPRHMKRYL